MSDGISLGLCVVIVHIVSNFFGEGTVSWRAQQDAIALSRAGYRVAVITDSLRRRNAFEEDSSISGLSVITRSTLPRFTVAKEVSFAAQCYRVLLNLAKNESVDLVVCHGSTPCYGGERFAKRAKIPGVFVIQALIRDKIGTPANPYSWLTTQMYRHANRFAASRMHYSIAVSSYVKDLAIAEGARPDRVFVLHNPIDVRAFSAQGDETKDIDVLFIGRLVAEKGLPVLIRAAGYLSRGTRISIVGDGPLRNELERQAQQVQCDIVFEGWIEKGDMPHYIRRAKLHVLPSLSEAQGLVVLEAMACGVPVIGTETGGIPDMIRHGENGWLVVPNDADALAKTIQAALANEKRRQEAGQAACKTAGYFSVKRFADRAVRLYEGIMGGAIK
ncbi:MAG: glycosyltransferase family 4 protein [Thermodesulfobacteriota bacterium]|nr:glycosyltransferase family 4 protein [Thermodesulfobacteriota bacterium]